VEKADIAALAALLRADAVASMPPYPMWYRGRDTIVRTLTAGMTEDSPHFVGRFRAVETAANRQPAVALYRCPPGAHVFRPFALTVLRVEGDQLAEITSFVDAGLFAKFGLPEIR
jgi:RNA polymerase sigma-70 factor (ECF subfamily)